MCRNRLFYDKKGRVNEYYEARYRILWNLETFFNEYQNGEHRNAGLSGFSLKLQEWIRSGMRLGIIFDYEIYLYVEIGHAICKGDRDLFWQEIEGALTPDGEKILSLYKNNTEEDEK